MKTPFLLFLVLAAAACTSQQSPEMVTISGRVTDFDGNPIDNVTVKWGSPDFRNAYYTKTDAAGRYCACIPQGRYTYVVAVDMRQYVHSSSLPRDEQRLEYWGWNFVLRGDTTLDMRYHRLEVYGVNASRVPGGVAGYNVYFRPMSLTRYYELLDAGKLDGHYSLAPDVEHAKIEVTIDSRPAIVRTCQAVTEYGDEKASTVRYLLFVEQPEGMERGDKLFHIVMTDIENGDKGEATYFLEELADADFIWPEGEIDATYKR